MKKITLCWFRRDLRLSDQAALFYALKEQKNIQPVFVFDSDILEALQNPLDRRVQFIYETLEALKIELKNLGSDLWVEYGKPSVVFKNLFKENSVEAIYCNHDYEPQAILRDQEIEKLCYQHNVIFKSFKDQVIFEKNEVLTDAGKSYTVFTPYKKKWLSLLTDKHLTGYPTETFFENLNRSEDLQSLISLEQMGFQKQDFIFPKRVIDLKILKTYAEKRDFPALASTSLLGLHLRFGTVSVRKLVQIAKKQSEVWLSELIWREFFMQILFHYPHVVKTSFRPQYEKVEWRNVPEELEKWKNGQTGYPIVDAGMRELNQTGHMHNRVRMVVGSFLTKHLMHHWLHGERYFARQLLDFDLSANNGNWQWCAGTGCDAAPYFRVFNPESQAEKFDPQNEYIKKWVPELGTSRYVKPMVEHKFARERALQTFARALKGETS